MTTGEDAKELLDSSQKLREDLMTAVGKLDAYIQQLKDAMQEGDDGTSRT